MTIFPPFLRHRSVFSSSSLFDASLKFVFAAAAAVTNTYNTFVSFPFPPMTQWMLPCFLRLCFSAVCRKTKEDEACYCSIWSQTRSAKGTQTERRKQPMANCELCSSQNSYLALLISYLWLFSLTDLRTFHRASYDQILAYHSLHVCGRLSVNSPRALRHYRNEFRRKKFWLA